MEDGTRGISEKDKPCDGSRDEPCDYRVGLRFKTKHKWKT
ncbi:hypothetical protein CLV48_105172 [Cecembia rubra]|uniref:Uncharacterized protein n=1 Tax=Cecembia rubra TaxID=1485585 RepID=A0A2P8E4M4_9BACT|nr:hypothetical protein CLV48_105172 [Cecembia rubra]